MFGTVKRTLCEIVLAAGTFGIVGCNITPTTAPDEYVEIISEEALQHEVDYFNNKQYGTLIDLITKRNARLDAESRRMSELFKDSSILKLPLELKTSAAERTLFALAYAMNGDYQNA